MKSNLDKPGRNQKKSNIVVTIGNEGFDRINIKPYLTIRDCLSLHAKTYDPLGLILPTNTPINKRLSIVNGIEIFH